MAVWLAIKMMSPNIRNSDRIARVLIFKTTPRSAATGEALAHQLHILLRKKIY
jgi:hypothetical protein